MHPEPQTAHPALGASVHAPWQEAATAPSQGPKEATAAETTCPWERVPQGCTQTGGTTKSSPRLGSRSETTPSTDPA